MKKFLLILSIICIWTPLSLRSQEIALLKYRGGGDWYANPTSLPNLIRFVNENLGASLSKDYATVEVGSPDLFRYPFIHMTGHGNVVFSEEEANNLRNYLIGGGFLHIDDNYGLKQFILPQMKLVFPELDFVELPYNHPIFHQKYKFPNGLPKIHEHDNQPPQAFGLFWEGRMVCLFTLETDLGDGWEDYEVHKNSEATRTKALQMGANIIQYVFTE
ncbi:DUF4159 domain-containing protein [Bacteroidales bacterium OttesenSCG-928-B11]|nr:DUF4159 domain-containing protein [Bacteroidales bacterium OttesenSCG-928-C03]MDL2311865.1 DUF4159 domain-containing protein [Bacteroidales bacterium OttesenSCG-928-B11]MDL2326178.1 DUF4159 domain-containing protein [Bacteroidales bacterium OttesenSCG-928-A14]